MGLFGKKKTPAEILEEGRSQYVKGDLKKAFLTLHALAAKGDPQACWYVGRIYLERIPIARQTTALAEEMHTDPVIAALNGGEDYELLFTVPLAMQEQVMRLGLVDVIGHITAESTGAYLVTPDGSEIKLKAQGFQDK